MSYKATSYVATQTVVVTAVGFLWLILASENAETILLPEIPEVAFGVIFGTAFYAHITVEETRSLSRTGVAKVSWPKWLSLAAVAPTVFAIIYYFTTTDPLKATALFFYTIIVFIIAGGATRTVLLCRWEKTHGRIIIASVHGRLYAIPKIPNQPPK